MIWLVFFVVCSVLGVLAHRLRPEEARKDFE